MTAMIHPAMQAIRGAAPVRAEVETAATPVGIVVDKVAVVTAVAATVAETPVGLGMEEAMAAAMAMVEEGGNGACEGLSRHRPTC
jgi:hypothetical protein